ncbi:NADH dehydrogenase [Bacteroidia bacterium]|nr:NADH dehydrogenase [Bacteroidia bacterium]
MQNIANIPPKKEKKRVVVVGGGFAGLEFSKKINPKHFQVVLVDKVNYYQFQPLLYQVATAGLEPSSISYPHRKAFQKHPDFHFRRCEAVRAVPEHNALETTIGTIHYDYLVVATGCDTNYFGEESLRENTFALKSVSEALLMRNRILLSFEESLCARTEEDLRKRLTFVVVGGGATGIELAGALADMKKRILPKDYPELDFSKMEIHLIDASPRLLAAMSVEASEEVARTLRQRGVILYHDKAVKSYEGGIVEMNDGAKIASNNVFWVAGVKPNSLAGFPENVYLKGRLQVDECNRVAGLDNVFCLGDTALMKTEKFPFGHPQLAQPAIQQARKLAENLNKRSKTKFEKFEYNDRGTMATIGRNAAVAAIGKLKFKGRVAWWLWLVIHIMSIVGNKNKVTVFINWIWSYLNYDVSLRVLILPKFSKIYHEKYC